MTEFLSVEEVAALLKTTRGYVYKLVCERRLPCYKPNGGRLLFDPVEIEEFIRSGRRSTHRELSDRATAILNSRRK
ncbi:DNA binding domain protein, excisionase family (fragment) [uncultured spirochete]|uniref:DNA binding domain protein, excisionase family n=1 Tax=uncultured spirochete TaxID=156406 RepID=A0A3P3XR02_9SPIR